MKSKLGGFTLVEILIVILILAIIISIALPNFMHAREVGRARACQATLRHIASAKEQWAMDNRADLGSQPTPSDLVDQYIKHQPAGELPLCPLNGTYSIGRLADQPTCSVGGNENSGDWDDHVIQW